MEVKFKFKYLALALGIFTGLASCSNDDDDVNPAGTIIDDGVPTTLRINISQAKNTYATHDPNATEDEAKIENVDVFIYNKSNVLLDHVQISGSQFAINDALSDQDKDVHERSTVIETTTGEKKIYVGVNLPTVISSRISTTTNMSALADIYNIDIDDLADSGNGFAMFSTKEENPTLVEDPIGDGAVNTINVEVARLVAKFSVHQGGSLSYDIEGGKIEGLQFSIGNSNRKIYPFQQTQGSTIVDPNYDFDTNPFIIADNFKTYGDDTDYIAINPSSANIVKDYAVKYAPENTTKMYYQKETTYVSVRGQFIPAIYTTDISGTTSANTNSSAETFWTVKFADGSIRYFNDEDVAEAVRNANQGSEMNEYEDGWCYYNMFINPTNTFDIVRNTYYKATITAINGIGNPDPGTTDPDEQVEIDTNMLINIEVLAWQEEFGEYELRP